MTEIKNKFEKHYVCQTATKVGNAKDKIVSKLDLNFRGLITIIVKRPSYGGRRDYVARKNNYILNCTMWKRISSEYMMELSKGMTYEHIDLYGDGV